MGQREGGRFKASACGNAIKKNKNKKTSAAGLKECEEAVLVELGLFNGTGKNNFDLRSMCVWGNRHSARVICRARRQEKEPFIGLSDVQCSTADRCHRRKTGNLILHK